MSRVTSKEQTLIRKSWRIKTGIEGHDLPQMPNGRSIRRRRNAKEIESFSAHGLQMSSATYAQKEDPTRTTKARMQMRTWKGASYPEVNFLYSTCEHRRWLNDSRGSLLSKLLMSANVCQ